MREWEHWLTEQFIDSYSDSVHPVTRCNAIVADMSLPDYIVLISCIFFLIQVISNLRSGEPPEEPKSEWWDGFK